MGSPLTLDEIVSGSQALTEADLIHNELVQRLVRKAEWQTVERTVTAAVGKLLEVGDGNLLMSGKALDAALTDFMCVLKAEMGDGFAANCAAVLIHNIALFLQPERGEAVREALGRS